MKKVKSLSNAIGGKMDIKERVTQKKTLPFCTILQEHTAISLIIIEVMTKNPTEITQNL